MCLGGPRRLRGYGDLRLRARARDRGVRVGCVGATGERFAVRALAPDAAGSPSPRRRVIWLTGEAIHIGCWRCIADGPLRHCKRSANDILAPSMTAC
jgi:hypothetical protein